MTLTENYIQSQAWTKFPARELWIKDDKQFWAYDYNIDDNTVTFTSGEYDIGNFVYNTTVIKFYGNIDMYIDSRCDSKDKAGYKCFASQLFI